MFNAMLMKLKQMGLALSKHKPPISKEDLGTFYKFFNINSPTGLQNKVFVDFMLCFCNRGRENLRELKKADFTFHGSGDNRYIQLRDHFTKNHRRLSTEDDESQGGRLYCMPCHKLCSVASLEKYISVLHPALEWFWQRPRGTDKVRLDDDI